MTNHAHSADTGSDGDRRIRPRAVDLWEGRPAEFRTLRAPVGALPPPSEEETTPALKLTGPPPFPRSRFPLLGLLSTVYEQIATQARELTGEDSSAGTAP